METKICTACGRARPLTEFHRFGKCLARVGKWCEDCYQKKKGNASKQSEQGTRSGSRTT